MKTKIIIFVFVLVLAFVILNNSDNLQLPSDTSYITSVKQDTPKLFTKEAYSYISDRAFDKSNYTGKIINCSQDDEYLEADIYNDIEVKEEYPVDEVVINEEKPYDLAELDEGVYEKEFNYIDKVYDSPSPKNSNKIKNIYKKPRTIEKKVYVPKKKINKKSNVKKVYYYRDYDEDINEEVKEDIVIYKPKKVQKIVVLDNKSIYRIQMGTFRYLQYAKDRKFKSQKLGIPSIIIKKGKFWVVISKYKYNYSNAVYGAKKLINNNLEALLLKY